MLRPTVTFALVTCLAGACGPGRTAPATQPSPALFEASKSDAKAVTVADQVIAACGGEAAWAKARQLSWDQKIQVDDQSSEFHHDWDRWDGRHHYTFESGDRQMSVAYEIYGDTKWATADGEPVALKDTAKLVEVAKKRFASDAYTLFFPFRLKDPGVVLKYVGERPAVGGPAGGPAVFDEIKVSMDGGGGDTFYVVVSKDSHLIDHIEMVEHGKADTQRLGYRFEDWITAGGLKVSMKRTNIGHAGEVWTFSNLKISDSVDEDLFVPVVK
jgi:hypothetical protein